MGDSQEMYDLVLNGAFPFIKNLHADGDSAYSKYMGDAIFKIPTPAMLTKIIDGIDSLDLTMRTARATYTNICFPK